MKIEDKAGTTGKFTGMFKRGTNMFNDAEIIQGPKDGKAVQGTGAVEQKEDSDFDNDIDFTVTLGSRKMTLRVGSKEEKSGWVKALETASIVRSHSSKHLGDSPEAEKQATTKMKTLLTLEDLDIGEIIGSGSAGTVKLAVHIPTGMRVAVKIIPKRKFFMNKKLEETTNRELEMLDQISEFEHPHIVHTYGYINDPQNVYIVLELCEGGELLEQLEQIHNYSEHDAASICEQMCSTLSYLHGKGIVHRDIKPENILLKKKGEADSMGDIKLADFGLSNIMEGKDSLQTVCGSPAYMAPEVHNMDEYDEKCDVWSVGIMLFLLLSGQLPFLPPRLVEKAEAQNYEFKGKVWNLVSDAAKDLVVNLLVANPKHRYSVGDVLKHPWITGEKREMVDLKSTQQAIALFSAKRKFKGMAHAVIASGRMKKAMMGFSNVAIGQTVGVIGSAVAVTTDLAYTAMDAGDKAMDTEIAKSAVGAAKAGMELEAVKKTRALTEQSIERSRMMTEKGLQATMDASTKGLNATMDVSKKGMAAGMDVTKQGMAAGMEVTKQGMNAAGMDSDIVMKNGHLFSMVGGVFKEVEDGWNASVFSPKNDERRKKMDGVRSWLDGGRLGIYDIAFEREGYDDVQALKELEESEIEELIVEVQMKKGHARHFKRRMKELQSYELVDDSGSPAFTLVNSADMVNSMDLQADAPDGFIPYEHLPMPPGDDSDLTFQLGVGIGRVKKKLVADEEDIDETIVEVHAGRETSKRIKSPPRPHRGDTLSPSPSPRAKAKADGSKSPRSAGGKGKKKKKNNNNNKKKKKFQPDEKRADVKLAKTKDGSKSPNAKLGDASSKSPLGRDHRFRDYDSGSATLASTPSALDTDGGSLDFDTGVKSPIKKKTSVKLFKKCSEDFEVPLGAIAGEKSTI